MNSIRITLFAPVAILVDILDTVQAHLLTVTIKTSENGFAAQAMV